MEIEFNTSRVARADSGQPVARQQETPSVSDNTSFTATDSLEARLNVLPTVRPEQVDQAKSLLSNPNYPPVELLDRIAKLLAEQNVL
jgi:hypothetical protein